MKPLVSVICLCYNQKDFVREAIESVWSQTHLAIELIVVDDASTDGSKEIIHEILQGQNVQFLDLKKNIGHCAAFNQGYIASHGNYLIDLAADDLLLPKRVEEGVKALENAPPDIGIQFTDAYLIKENGTTISTHYHRDAKGNISDPVPEGNIYLNLIQKYFISPPTMMFRRSVLDQLGGYDESLIYEDFDFWIRSSRHFKYIFHPAPLVKRRLVANSDSHNQFSMRSRHSYSTYQVCKKILELNQTSEEHNALMKRCKYEIRTCVKTFNFSLILKYKTLIRKAKLAIELAKNASQERSG